MSHITELQNLLLENRGIKTAETKEKFLNPNFDRDMHDPYLMKDMEKAVVRIFEAMKAMEKIVIYGDYDCDGIPGSVILSDLFKKVGYENLSVYIPHRHDEGYGLHKEAIESFRNDGVNLIITVDLGTVNFEEVALAESFGINVIVTDHHLIQSSIPRAYAVINPKRIDGVYPEKMLCGAGVAFKLVQAFIKKYGEYYKINIGWEKWLLDLAGLSTLSDMVPLTGENRTIAYFGMKVLRKNCRPGFSKLFNKLNIDTRYLVEDDITFMVTPRLNAASRMDSPMRAFELLAATDDATAGALADHLTKINDERKSLVAQMMKEVKNILEKREEKSVIVIGNPKWRIGILGLVASKISEEHKKPAFVWGSNDLKGSDPWPEKGVGPLRVLKGSCRSDGIVNLVRLMSLLPENTLLEFGGHELAGGFAVTHEQVHFLEEHLCVAYKSIQGSDPKKNEGDGPRGVDKKMLLEEVTIENYEQIEKLAPFGLGNPKPSFLFENIEIENIKQFGKANDHLEIIFKDKNSRQIKAIQFFKTHSSFGGSLKKGDRINLVANFERSMFRNRAELRLRIIDIF
jgi:single-stranded-DNA-specific exonuclease